VPSSFGLILQRWGRSFRLKCSDYPQKHKDTATISFFVPSISDELLDDYEKTHHDHSLLLACYMADWQTGTEYRNALQIKFASARREQRGEPQNETEELERIDYEQSLVVPEMVRLQANADICKLEAAREEANLPPPTHAEVVKHFEEQGASEETIHAVGVMLAEKLPPAAQAAVADKVARKMLTGWSAQNPVRPELRAVFKEVVADYEDRTHGVLGVVSRFYTELTGVDSQNVAARLKDMLVKPDLTEDMIIEAAKVHLAREGKFPEILSGDATADFGFPETWKSVEGALHVGYRGLQEGSSLYKLLVMYGLKSEKPELTESLIVQAALNHLNRTGKLPANNSGDATCDFGFPETWVSVNQSLVGGYRGLQEGSSLSAVLIKHGLKVEKPDLTELMIVTAAQKCLARTGRPPTQSTKGATEDFGHPETWTRVCVCLSQGFRGFPGGSSLSELLKKHALQRKPAMTELMIIEAAQKYLIRTGRSPTQTSGDAGEDFGFAVTWTSVDQALRVGVRGLPGRSSLYKCLITHGVTDEKHKLSEEIIAEAARKCLTRTGKLPGQHSGDASEDFGFPEKWHNIYAALRNGQRGLDTKGSSLSQLFKKHGLK
jgi:hypothetical protein